jgi:hypothetical protein
MYTISNYREVVGLGESCCPYGKQEVGYGCPSARAASLLTSLAAEMAGLTSDRDLFLDFGWFNSLLFRLLEFVWFQSPGNIHTN